MKTLKELVEIGEILHLDDITIIENWFIENNKESEGLSLIPRLAKSQTEKVQRILDYARSWLPNMPDLESCNKKLTKDKAENLQRIETIHLLSLDLANYEELFNWAKKEIPKMEIPKVFFTPCIEWLEEKYEIKFKGVKQ